MSDALIDLEAESEILAALIAHGRLALARIREHFEEPGVFSAENRPAAEVCFSLAAEGEPIMPSTVRARAYFLGHDALAKRADDWLGELLVSCLGTLDNAAAHAKIVGELAHRRELIAASDQLRRTAADRSVSVQDSVGQLMDRVTVHATRSREDSTRDYLAETLQEIDERASSGGSLSGISTRLDSLDTIIDGLDRSRLVVCAARPGWGKTAFGVWCAEQAAEDDHETLFASAEQPTKQLNKRRLGIKTGLDIRALERNKAEWNRHMATMTTAAGQLRLMPLTFNQGVRTVSDIRMSVQKQIVLNRKPRLVVVDYLTKLKAEGTHDRHDLAVGSMTGALARMAVELEICVLLLAQLNRDSVKDGKVRRPSVADLRDSGVIEQDADQILLLWPGSPAEDEHSNHRATDVARVEIIVDKNRHGPLGTACVEWNKASGRFWDERRWPSRDIAA